MTRAFVLLGWTLGLMGSAWSGAARTDAPDPSLEVPPAAFQADGAVPLSRYLAAWLQEALTQRGWPVEVSPQGIWGLPRDMPATVHARLTGLQRKGDAWQLTAALVDANGAALGTARFSGLARQAVWTVASPIRQGDTLGCGQLRSEERVLRTTMRPWQGDCGALSGMQARRALQPGAVLGSTDVGPPQAVRRQQDAVVMTRLNGIEIQAAGQVLADAQVGQRVPVKLNGQTTVLQAMVISPGQVQVMEGW